MILLHYYYLTYSGFQLDITSEKRKIVNYSSTQYFACAKLFGSTRVAVDAKIIAKIVYISLSINLINLLALVFRFSYYRTTSLHFIILRQYDWLPL